MNTEYEDGEVILNDELSYPTDARTVSLETSVRNGEMEEPRSEMDAIMEILNFADSGIVCDGVEVDF